MCNLLQSGYYFYLKDVDYHIQTDTDYLIDTQLIHKKNLAHIRRQSLVRWFLL